jgi:hypothetical protein
MAQTLLSLGYTMITISAIQIFLWTTPDWVRKGNLIRLLYPGEA